MEETARERAERRLAHVIDCKRHAIEGVTSSWDAKIDRARAELHEARKAEAAANEALAEWTLHDGGACPVGDVPVLFRTKWEWAAMLAGEPFPISEDNSRYAYSLRWRWEGKDHDDIAAYRLASVDTLRNGQDPQGLGAEQG
jgi:hypothetical protein